MYRRPWWRDCLCLSHFTLTFGLEICSLNSFSVSSFGATEVECPSGLRAKAIEVYKSKQNSDEGGWGCENDNETDIKDQTRKQTASTWS